MSLMSCLQLSHFPKCLQFIFPAGDDLSLWDAADDFTPSNDLHESHPNFTAQQSFIESIRAGFVTFLDMFTTTNTEATDRVPDTHPCETHFLLVAFMF